jgi:hypothetical protein
MSPPTPGRSRNRSPAGFQRRSAHSQASAPCAPDRRVHRRQGLDQATSQPPYCARRSGPASSTTSAGDGPDTSTVASHRRRVIRTCRHHRSGIRATDRLSQSGLIFGRAPRGSGCVPSRDVRAANGGGALSYPCFPGQRWRRPSQALLAEFQGPSPSPVTGEYLPMRERVSECYETAPQFAPRARRSSVLRTKQAPELEPPYGIEP